MDKATLEKVRAVQKRIGDQIHQGGKDAGKDNSAKS